MLRSPSRKRPPSSIPTYEHSSTGEAVCQIIHSYPFAFDTFRLARSGRGHIIAWSGSSRCWAATVYTIHGRALRLVPCFLVQPLFC
jgi:hypothetical protein